MAKISARGATEVARWKGDDGRLLVLTSDGRLLARGTVPGDGYKLVGRNFDPERAAAWARIRHYTRTFGR